MNSGFRLKTTLVFTLLAIINSFGQTFERAEIFSGFGILQGNSGVAVADYDRDNDLDIFVVANAIENPNQSASFSRLFQNNNNGTFTDVTETSGLQDLLTLEDTTEESFVQEGFKYGVSWGDFNNDGFPDILFTHALKVQLFINLGNGTFADVTLATGIQLVNDCINSGATWFDYNNDGFLDIYISDWDECDSNTLYRNNGNNTFTDVTSEVGLIETDSKASYTPFPFDINNDGWMDIIVSNDFNEPNYLYVNQSGTSFIEDAQNYGLDNMIDDMAIVPNDFDLDNDFDFFITGIDENALLKNNGSNNFTEDSQTHGITATGWAWGARFADFDLDGDEDLYVVNGYEFEDRSEEQNVFFRNLHAQGGTTFEDASAEVGLADESISVEAVDFDYDNDGDIDLFVTNASGSSYFYDNKLLSFDQPSDLKWLKVVLQGTVSNRDGIGTTLELTTSSGVISRYYTGVGFLGQSLLPVHFGIDQESTITELKITWPSGIVETYQNIDANTTVKATENTGLEVLDIEPSQKIYGCMDPESCTYNPEATLNDDSCEYIEANVISGSTSSGFYETETYTYEVADGSSTIWTVSGGEIIDGQGTDSITVRWHIEETGTLTVREFDGDCYSLPVTLNVSLNISQSPEDKSIARIWNEALLEAIRGDFARPTVHARNLFHSSIAMYDAWAIYDQQARPYLIGNSVNGFNSELLDFIPIESIEESRNKAISFAMYRLLSHRFQNSPGAEETQGRIDLIMEQLGYNTSTTTTSYEFGNAAALGNYIAETIISYGMQDGSREATGYDNAYYEPINTPLNPTQTDLPFNIDPNRWQPLSLNGFVDQSGNLIDGDVIDFLSPEWGNVHSFAMGDDDVSFYERDGDPYKVYNDPLEPPYISVGTETEPGLAYKWGFSMVSVWQSHNDPNDGVLWDISPKSIGNIPFEDLPTNYQQYPDFYNFFEGGDISQGHAVNPVTGQAYEEQIVPRGDYTRVLAEFWADGPDSETPPGHWFTILNYVNDNPQFEKRFAGEGDILDPLEWDVKAYFILGGTMHDAAISAWSIKGWYDYIRPVSAIRFMETRGQSTDESLTNYHVAGLPLIDGFIEIVQEGDPLAGVFNQNVGRIKLYTWRGHDYIINTETDTAGVGWILADSWWPYQRPNFVTPPFAGYVSGHSTYSRAAAEVMTRMTGSEFFPGGVGEFIARQDEFLVFEDGPSVDVILQWATYRDASDQCSLSRIWGGIHPPADDIPGRIIGEKVGREAYDFAVPYFNSDEIIVNNTETIIYPNPTEDRVFNITNTSETDTFEMFDIRGRKIDIISKSYNDFNQVTVLRFAPATSAGLYMLKVNSESTMVVIKD
ncbi:FG-GAP-like repeat-containing protein [Winogradskyella sp. 3972H.M.0a.05]|uniref:FG-GAP-like repeat-containing protein n=1 Tax=Winogradskyella sp. 3972H.M.0a.05 TaxID=2950277 RepID=UPI003393515B